MFSPERLELARRRRRYTGTILANRAKIAPVTLSRIVNGKQTPDDETIDRLARALEYPKEFFFEGAVDSIDASSASFRSLKAMTARERDAAIAAGSLAYIITDWVQARFNLPEADLLGLDSERDPETAARTLRTYWGIGEKPIGNITSLLESKGVRVFALAENTKNVDAFSCWRNDEAYIFLNKFKTAERSRFDAAHELGHLVLHKHGGARQGRSAESEANAFASAFLMPPADVFARLPYVTTLREIVTEKRRWGVSAMALAYRLRQLNLITEWQHRTFCIQINRSYGASEPNGLPHEPSSLWQMVLTELWKDGISRNHIAAELHIPYQELETLLFGLTAEIDRPPRTQGHPPLRAVK